MQPDTIEQVEANIDELNSKPIPDKDVLLLRELDHLDGEIARAGQQLTLANSWGNQQMGFVEYADRMRSQSQAIAQIDCQNNIPKFRTAVQSYLRASNDFQRHFGTLDTLVDFTALGLPPFAGDETQNCMQLKAKFESQEYLDAQKHIIDSLQTSLTTFLTGQTNLAAAEKKYLEALKKRRSSVQDKLNAAHPAFQIGSYLWLLILILAFACVSTILGIKLFDANLQMEWVASGQVIQFVTVMILLSVILALGLSSKLSENTLGTLLGGIAGYVLAQGVGRSAARNVERAALASSPATPPAGRPPATTPPAETQ